MKDILYIYSESDAFSEYWEGVASKSGVELSMRADLDDVAGCPVVIISCVGIESRASGLTKDALAAGSAPVLVVGADSDHRLAAAVVRAGAADYFVLPADAELLEDDVRARIETRRASSEKSELLAEARGDFDFSQIIGSSAPLKAALGRAARIIPRGNATVLITGETGTGKELLARAVHYNGPRADGPFVDVNCSAIPDKLLESELFGHEKGAFTDAKRAKPGLFEVADGGSLLLDEIGEIPFELQGKLLRAIEEKEIRRIGGTRTSKVDVRIIAATNVDLAAAVRDGNFREDLYYRLSVIPIRLPPLSERGDDIFRLAGHFIESICEEYGLTKPTLSRDFKDSLLAHSWPGNIRELRNAIERALLLSEGELDAADLFLESAARGEPDPQGRLPFPATLELIELAAVREMLELTDGNKSDAARRLGISRSRLHRAIKRLEEGS